MKKILLIACLISGCTNTQLQNNNGVALDRVGAGLIVPPPPSFLPKPYVDAKLSPSTEEQIDYARYLQETEMFPDQELCKRNLLGRIQDISIVDSIQLDWVTNPYLAWGGVWDAGAVVGPIEYLFSITEAHVTYLNKQNQEIKLTYSCYVQYAQQQEKNIWRSGFLKYGYGTKEGHKKYISYPTAIFATGSPGKVTAWESGIRYYVKD